jgi:hypothetical protein
MPPAAALFSCRNPGPASYLMGSYGMGSSSKWARCLINSPTNFDLILTNPESLDFENLRQLLAGVRGEQHRGSIKLTSRATQEFQRWFDDPATPLKSEAYVLLSNWFLTDSGDRKSMVATRCLFLWDALFPCRPADRLSSPAPGRNHVMLPAEFVRFWRRLVQAQGGELPGGDSHPQESPAGIITPVSDAERSKSLTSDLLTAIFDKEGLHFEVKGSARALADFLQRVSQWETRPGQTRWSSKAVRFDVLLLPGVQ